MVSRRRRTPLSRSKVVQTAIECIEREGAKSLGVNRIARELGIRPPSLYHYVTGNDDLERAVAIAGWSLLIEQLEGVVEVFLAEASRTASETLQAGTKLLAESHRQFALENPVLQQVMLTTGLETDPPALLTIKRKLIAVFRQVVQPLELDDDTLLHVMRAVRSAAIGFAALENGGQFVFPVDHTGSFDWFIDTLIAGVSARMHTKQVQALA